nr:LD34846p [Drosophila melanogaster]
MFFCGNSNNISGSCNYRQQQQQQYHKTCVE